MILASLRDAQGNLQTVEVYGLDARDLIKVSPTARRSGYYWDTAPVWVVSVGSLFHFRMNCGACGKINPMWQRCECGWDPNEPLAQADEPEIEEVYLELKRKREAE